jgi:hypothetical protein
MNGQLLLGLMLILPAGKQGVAADPAATALAEAVRSYALRTLPTPLYETSRNWDHTAPAATGLKWKTHGLHTQVRVAKAPRKDGTWRKVRITAINPAQELRVAVQNLRQAEPGRTTFELWIAMPARVDYERQTWKAGVKLLDVKARARFQIELAVSCEANTRVEWQGNLVPEAVLQLRLTKANFGYEHLVVEHLAGLGGDGAKLLGDVVEEAIHQWHPSLEKGLLAHADAAIEKAGQTREIRLGVSTLLKMRK